MFRSDERNQHFDRLVNTKGLRWLGQNTNHHPPHPAVRSAMLACIDGEEYHAYAPPLGFEALREAVLSDLGLPEMAAMITDGAVSGLHHLCNVLCVPGSRMVTTDPTWAWPMLFARQRGADVTQIPIYGEEHGWRLDPTRLAEEVDKSTSVIYLVDPNNPLGTACTEAEIIAIAEIARKAGATLIHDCTYRDFARNHHLAAHHYPEGTVTVWSFSKWLGLAGLRVGALVAAPDMIERLAAAPPNILGSNILAQRAAIAGLEVKQEWFPDVVATLRANQEAVKMACDAIEGLEVPVWPSDGNFLIIECTGAGVAPEALCAVMARHEILIRQGSYHTLAFGDRFIKVSLSVPPDWVADFCARLPGAVAEARGMNADVTLF